MQPAKIRDFGVPLTEPETLALREAEATISQNIAAFVLVGRALRKIRDDRLYREKFTSFDAYLRERWDLSRSRGYELIAGALVVANVSAIADGRQPLNEAQVRPLTVLEPDQQRQAWARALQTAPNGRVTARHVAQIVRQYLETVNGGSLPPEEPGEIDELMSVLRELGRHVRHLATEQREVILDNLRRLLEAVKPVDVKA